MKRSKIKGRKLKNNLLLLILTWSLIQLSAIPATGLIAQNSQSVLPEAVSDRQGHSVISFNLHFLDNYIFLGKVNIYPGYLPSRILNNLPDDYSLEVVSHDGDILYRQNFRNPQIAFYDNYESEYQIMDGGFVQKEYGIINFKIPWLETASRIAVYSPKSEKIYEILMSDLVRKDQPVNSEQQVRTETLIYNGDPDNRIDLLFMGDGYILEDSTLFRNDVIEFINHLFATSPYNEYYNFFNVHLVYVVSQERGADHPELQPPVYRNTALDASYNCNNIPRLICANEDTIYDIAQTTFPYYDEITVLINDPVYGGSGGSISMSYNGGWGKWVFNHELGHSFGLLLDEYLYGNQPGFVSGCNCDVNFDEPKWQPWITLGSPGVGAFAGCSWTNYYRPTNNECTMNTLQNSFCVVCTEQLAKAINIRVLLYENYFPLSNPVVQIGDSQLFYIEPLQPMNHEVSTHWYINDIKQPGAASDSFYYLPQNTGNFRLMAVVFDSTSLVINDPDYLMLDAVEWQVNVVPSTGIDDAENGNNPSSLILFPNYPNPFNPRTVISWLIPSPAQGSDGQLAVGNLVKLSIYDLSGREIVVLVNEEQSAGLHQVEFDASRLASGVYYCCISVGSLSGVAGEYVQTRKMLLLK